MGSCYSGTPVDCVSLALSGALFSWSKPALVCIMLSFATLHLDFNFKHFS